MNKEQMRALVSRDPALSWIARSLVRVNAKRAEAWAEHDRVITTRKRKGRFADRPTT